MFQVRLNLISYVGMASKKLQMGGAFLKYQNTYTKGLFRV